MEVQRSQVDAGSRVLGIDRQNLLVECDGAILLACFLSFPRGLEALLKAARVGHADAAQRRRACGSLLLRAHAFEVKEQLAADGIDHGAPMTEGERGPPGAHPAS